MISKHHIRTQLDLNNSECNPSEISAVSGVFSANKLRFICDPDVEQYYYNEAGKVFNMWIQGEEADVEERFGAYVSGTDKPVSTNTHMQQMEELLYPLRDEFIELLGSYHKWRVGVSTGSERVSSNCIPLYKFVQSRNMAIYENVPKTEGSEFLARLRKMNENLLKSYTTYKGIFKVMANRAHDEARKYKAAVCPLSEKDQLREAYVEQHPMKVFLSHFVFLFEMGHQSHQIHGFPAGIL